MSYTPCPDAPYIKDAERYGGGYEPKHSLYGRAIDDDYMDDYSLVDEDKLFDKLDEFCCDLTEAELMILDEWLDGRCISEWRTLR